jgi:PTS system mannose-specific IIA component
MVGVLVATHGRLGEELLATAAAVCGPLERARAVSLSADRPVEEGRAALAAAIGELEQGDGVLVLTDMFGGTPSNLALGFLDGKVEVVTGVNLPMLLKLTTARAGGASLAAVAELIAGYGQKNVTRASQLLRDRTKAGAP